MLEHEVDAKLATLRDLVNRAAIAALTSSPEAQTIIGELEQMGFRIRLTVGVSVQRNEPAAQQAGRLVTQRRWCPHCSTAETPFHLRGHIVRDRIAGSGERDVIEGLQVRFTCSLCGYGEVEPIPVDGEQSA